MSDDFRYLVFEVVEADIRHPGEVGSVQTGRVGQMYAACDDFELAMDIVGLLERGDKSSERLQLMVYDTLDGSAARPA